MGFELLSLTPERMPVAGNTNLRATGSGFWMDAHFSRSGIR
jgi:hypothetical protein